MNFQDMSGIKLKSSMRYKKRYKYDGSITSNIIRDLNSSTDDINDIITNNITQSWNLKWIHRQTIDPSQSLNINYSYVSVNDFSKMVLRITPTLVIAPINYTEDSQKLNSEIKELLELSKIIFSEIVYLKKLKPTIPKTTHKNRQLRNV